jgi:hypothetical protein
MTAAEKLALKSFVDALKVHEERHVTVTKDFGEEISGPQSAVGPPRVFAHRCSAASLLVAAFVVPSAREPRCLPHHADLRSAMAGTTPMRDSTCTSDRRREASRSTTRSAA